MAYVIIQKYFRTTRDHGASSKIMVRVGAKKISGAYIIKRLCTQLRSLDFIMTVMRSLSNGYTQEIIEFKRPEG